MVPGRGGGPTLSGGGFRFAIPTGTPAQAFLSSTSVTRSRSEGGGSRTFRVRTPVANGLVLLSRVGVGFRGSWAWIHNLVMIRLLVIFASLLYLLSEYADDMAQCAVALLLKNLPTKSVPALSRQRRESTQPLPHLYSAQSGNPFAEAERGKGWG